MNNIQEISTLIIHQQEAEVKAIKRVKMLRDKAKSILDVGSPVSPISERQAMNVALFLDIANEIENLNLTHKAMYKVLDVKITEAKSKAFILNSQSETAK